MLPTVHRVGIDNWVNCNHPVVGFQRQWWKLDQKHLHINHIYIFFRISFYLSKPPMASHDMNSSKHDDDDDDDV